MKRAFKLLAFVLPVSLLSVGFFARPILAQEISAFDPLNEFKPDEWSKPPINFGPFLLFSDVLVAQSYNDNFLAQSTGAKGDFFTTINPSAQLVKNVGRHNFGLALGASADRYWKYTDENTLDMSAAFMADFEAYHSLSFPFTFAISKEHQDRSNRRLSSVTKEPVTLDRKLAQGGFVFNPNRFKLEMIGRYEEYRVDDNVLMFSGAPLDGENNARDTYSLETLLTYDLRPNLKPVLKIVYTDDRYKTRAKTATGEDGFIRDGQSLLTLGGFLLDYKDLISASILIGPEKREYDEVRAESSDALSAEIKVGFKPTQRSLGTFEFTRKTQDDSLLLTGFIQEAYNLDLEQELYADWRARAGVTYKNTEYLSSSRVDDTYGAYGSLVYNVRRGLDLEGRYSYQERQSNFSDFSYDQNVFMIGLKHQF